MHRLTTIRICGLETLGLEPEGQQLYVPRATPECPLPFDAEKPSLPASRGPADADLGSASRCKPGRIGTKRHLQPRREAGIQSPGRGYERGSDRGRW